ncbi:hypothetical protein EUX98_g2341 [Antrodiella citrinella]|uniref:Uncharacterized protein n=1 Tax=Antrodiella citrinella TaxID=2447956 RepID=A0A4S4N0M2_9APHY|nr:hypothetical protein EUX98_g2341 [Antrodiella citrinella]
MGKRKRVAKGIHSELSEYSSLLRALRTTATLDLTSQLIHLDPRSKQRSAAQGGEGYEDDEDEDADEEVVNDNARGGANSRNEYVASETSEGVTAGDAEEPVASSSHSTSRPSQKRKSRAPATARDTWTKWPLVPSEVYTPEWPLDEEIRIIARDALQHIRASEAEASRNPDVESEDEDAEEQEEEYTFDEILTPVNVRALTRAATNRLYEMLAVSAAMLPKGEDSMQNRHGYINCELILSAMDAFGVFKPEQLENIKQRLLVLYPKNRPRLEQNSCFVDPKPPPPKSDRSYLTLDWYRFVEPSDFIEPASNIGDRTGGRTRTATRLDLIARSTPHGPPTKKHRQVVYDDNDWDGTFPALT